MANIEKDALSGVETTGHVWDGLQELNNPLPKWWLYIFYVCIAWAMAYYIFYPAWPYGSSYTKGILNWSMREEIVEKVAEGKAAQAKYLAKIDAMTVDDIQKDKDLLNFAMAGGRTMFNENCAACHGAGGQGAKGFPNLADDIWLWDGTTAGIYKTITGGVRQDMTEPPKGADGKPRTDVETRGTPGTGMPGFGKDGTLTKDQIDQVSEYILSLNNRATDAAKATKGKKVFEEDGGCTACHGPNAEGAVAAGLGDAIGAPPLKTANWLYGGDKATLVQTITNGRAGEMPTWSKRLSDTTIKQLAIYVHNLGGGK